MAEKTPRHLHMVPPAEAEPAPIDFLKTIGDTVAGFRERLVFDEHTSKKTIRGRVVTSHQDEPMHKLNVHIFNAQLQHGPNPKFIVAEIVSRVMDEPMRHFLLTQNQITKVYGLRQAIKTEGQTHLQPCDSHQERIVAEWLQHFQETPPAQ